MSFGEILGNTCSHIASHFLLYMVGLFCSIFLLMGIGYSTNNASIFQPILQEKFKDMGTVQENGKVVFQNPFSQTGAVEMEQRLGMQKGPNGKLTMTVPLTKEFVQSIAAKSILFLLVIFFVHVFYIVVATEAASTVSGALTRTAFSLLPLLIAYALIGLIMMGAVLATAFVAAFLGRLMGPLSFIVWLLVIVFIVAIGPRFALTPVVLIKEKLGIFKSIQASFERSAENWGTIFGNLFFIGILLSIAFRLCIVGIQFVPNAASPTVAYGLAGFVLLLVGARILLHTVFLVKLAEYVMGSSPPSALQEVQYVSPYSGGGKIGVSQVPRSPRPPT